MRWEKCLGTEETGELEDVRLEAVSERMLPEKIPTFYLFEKKDYKETENFYLLVHSSKACNSSGQVRGYKPVTPLVSIRWVGTQVLGPYPLLPPSCFSRKCRDAGH